MLLLGLPLFIKGAPIDEVSAFLDIFGRDNGGVIRCDQGGELANSNAFVSTMLKISTMY